MICFQISIFEPLETAKDSIPNESNSLWFAFKLVSLNHWKQPSTKVQNDPTVVICFQISIFEPLETARKNLKPHTKKLWFAFKLVSLNHWKQHIPILCTKGRVVICFQISIFEPLETASKWIIQTTTSCDLLSN